MGVKEGGTKASHLFYVVELRRILKILFMTIPLSILCVCQKQSRRILTQFISNCIMNKIALL